MPTSSPKTQHIISSHHHTFAPHQRLPFELLAEIFIQCIPSVEFRDLRRIYGVVNPFQVMEHGWMYPHYIRARLALVCRAWYTVLYNEPRVWTTMVLLDRFLARPETVSLWIKKSKSMPLVVFIPYCRVELGPENSVYSMLHQEMWRIRCLFWEISLETDLSALFPLDVSTNAPMLQNLALSRSHSFGPNQDTFKLGDIHCPKLRTLFLRHVNYDIKPLTVRPLKNVRNLSIDQLHDLHVDNIGLMYLKLLEALPNLVSLSWKSYSGYCTLGSVKFPRVVLQSLKSLTLDLCCKGMMTSMLECLHVPSLERLVLDVSRCYDFTESMDAICDSLVQLRHLTLRNMDLGRRVPALLNHLKHLETLTIKKLYAADELFIALSSHNRGSSIPCPHLKTVKISLQVYMKLDVLVDFVQQRVKSDLDDPAPGLVTCLKLDRTRYVEKPCAQLVKTQSSSILSGSHKLETRHSVRRQFFLTLWSLTDQRL